MYPKFFDLLDGEPRKAMRLSYELAAINSGSFEAAADKAVRENSQRQARECIRRALEAAGWASAESQAIAGAVKFSEVVT